MPSAPSSRCWTSRTSTSPRHWAAASRPLAAMAEDERQRIVKRANDGRKFARANGVQFGRKPKLTTHQRTEALKRLDAGESCRSIAKTMGVHHQTISKLAG